MSTDDTPRDPLAEALEAIWPYEDDADYFAGKAADLRKQIAGSLLDATRPGGDEALRGALIKAHEYIWTRAGQYHAPGSWPEKCVSCAALATRPSGDEALPSDDHDCRCEGQPWCVPHLARHVRGDEIRDCLDHDHVEGAVTLPARPSGDEALRAALENILPQYMSLRDVQPAIAALLDALATPSSAPDVEGLDVERLARALRATYTGGAPLDHRYYVTAATAIAREYAALRDSRS